MALKDKIKPLFFLLTLFLGGFFYNVCGATTYYVPTGTQIYGTVANNALNIENIDTILTSASPYCNDGHVRVYLIAPGSYCLDDPGEGCYTTISYIANSVSWTLTNDFYLYDLEFLLKTNTNNPYTFETQWKGSSCVFFGQCSVFDTNNDFYLQFSCENINTAEKVYPVYIELFRDSGTWSTSSSSVNGVCGYDDGQYLESTPPTIPYSLCSAGSDTEVVWSSETRTWSWSCEGSGGGTTDYCVSYLTADPVDGVCGYDDGQTLENPPIGFCATGELIFPSYVETIEGWSWSCSGYNGGANDYCSAIKSETIGTFPDLPTLEDCSELEIPNVWFCEMSNALKSVFLPTASKLNELQDTLNAINGRAPFNYIDNAKNNIDNLRANISAGGMQITLFGNTGYINLNAVAVLTDKIKIFFAFLIVIAFLFWGLNYIKHFFK